MRRRKRRPQPLPTIKLNNFTVSLWDKRKEILYPTSTATEAVEWVHGLFLFPLVLGKMQLPHAKLGLFLYSLDNLLQKNVIVLFFGNQISKWRSFEKRAIFDLLFTFFSHQGKVTKIPSAHITHILTRILLILLTFFALPILKKKIRIYQIRFLFGMSPGVDSYSRHFGTINK